MTTDVNGQPIRFILTGGQAADSPQGIPLLSGINTTHVIADKGYDSDSIMNFVQCQGGHRRHTAQIHIRVYTKALPTPAAA